MFMRPSPAVVPAACPMASSQAGSSSAASRLHGDVRDESLPPLVATVQGRPWWRGMSRRRRKAATRAGTPAPPSGLGGPVGARPALAAGASADDNEANRNDRKGRGCEAHAPIGHANPGR